MFFAGSLNEANHGRERKETGLPRPAPEVARVLPARLRDRGMEGAGQAIVIGARFTN